jgi:hypothetical protein
MDRLAGAERASSQAISLNSTEVVARKDASLVESPIRIYL